MDFVFLRLEKLGGISFHAPSAFFVIIKALLDLLEITIKNPQGRDDASTAQASYLYHFMNSFLFCFLIQVFNRILEQSSFLYMFLQNRNTDFSYSIQKIATFADFLRDLQAFS